MGKRGWKKGSQVRPRVRRMKRFINNPVTLRHYDTKPHITHRLHAIYHGTVLKLTNKGIHIDKFRDSAMTITLLMRWRGKVGLQPGARCVQYQLLHTTY